MAYFPNDEWYEGYRIGDVVVISGGAIRPPRRVFVTGLWESRKKLIVRNTITSRLSYLRPRDARILGIERP